MWIFHSSINGWGSGIKRIFNAAKEYGLLEPKFQEFDNMFRVELFRNSLPMTLENKSIGEASEKHRRNIGEVSEKQETVDFNSTQLEILSEIYRGKASL